LEKIISPRKARKPLKNKNFELQLFGVFGGKKKYFRHQDTKTPS